MPLNPAAEAFIKSTNKKLGEDLLVSADQLVVPMRFTSGSLSTDVILGGGWPGNQWSEILGKSSAGKTFLALKTVAANQKLNPEFTTLWVSPSTTTPSGPRPWASTTRGWWPCPPIRWRRASRCSWKA